MDLSAWAFYAFVTAAVLSGTVLHYRRREPAGRGRYVLAGLRGVALALLVLLVFDPVLPTTGEPGAGPKVALVDGSLSMRLPAPDGTTRWDEARRAVARLGPDAILVFGAGGARRVASLDDVAPDQPATRLGPALRSALETGAARVVVVTDGGIEDMEEALRVSRGARSAVETIRVGDRTAANLGIVELDVPGWARAGEEVAVMVAVGRIGEAAPDSVTVSVRWAGRELARGRVATPPEGRASTTTLRFYPPRDMAGQVRLDAILEETDVEPADDTRSGYIMVAERPAGVVLVSFHADQEPRFLLPLLERALGLPATGWLALGPERFVRVGVGPDAGRSDTEADVRRAVMGAHLVVLHGLSETAPAWARSAAATAPRALLFPREQLAELPVQPGPARPGDWYPDDDIPASPAAPFLMTVAMGATPPLAGLRSAPGRAGWWSPLLARQDRRGDPEPVLIAGSIGDRRVAIALADGYWRWAFDDAGGRALYDALWAGVGAWLVADAPGPAADAVRPLSAVVPRSEPIRWVAPPDTDSIRVTLHALPEPPQPASPASGPLDTVLVAVAGSVVQTPPAAGHYRYEARALLASGESVEGSGELTIERYSAEFTRPARPFDLTAGDGPPSARERAPSQGRPLRAMAWPYLAVVVLLCAEWVLRRRWGLR